MRQICGYLRLISFLSSTHNSAHLNTLVKQQRGFFLLLAINTNHTQSYNIAQQIFISLKHRPSHWPAAAYVGFICGTKILRSRDVAETRLRKWKEIPHIFLLNARLVQHSEREKERCYPICTPLEMMTYHYFMWFHYTDHKGHGPDTLRDQNAKASPNRERPIL